MSATAIRYEPAFGAKLNAVIIYDDFVSVTNINTMLENASYRACEAVHWNVNPWRVDRLDQMPTMKRSLAEAADAHLIVIALHELGSLQSGLLDWLEKWATNRQMTEAALAVCNGENGGGLSSTAISELSRLAGRHGLGFIFDGGGPAEDQTPFLTPGLQQSEVRATHLLQPAMDDSNQHWGIND